MRSTLCASQQVSTLMRQRPDGTRFCGAADGRKWDDRAGPMRRCLLRRMRSQSLTASYSCDRDAKQVLLFAAKLVPEEREWQGWAPCSLVSRECGDAQDAWLQPGGQDQLGRRTREDSGRRCPPACAPPTARRQGALEQGLVPLWSQHRAS